MSTSQVSMFDAHRTGVRPTVGEAARQARPQVMLRDYQRAAIDAIDAAERAGTRKQMVVLPTGAGKTVVFASLIAERQTKSLILAHRDELIDQARAKVRSIVPNAPVGIVQAGQNDPWAPVVIGSVQTLAQTKRLAQLAQFRFGLVIVDECHHSASPTYRRIIETLRAGEEDGPLLVGVTATPDRGDGVRLDDVFDRIVYTKSLIEMIAEGYLCDIRAVRVQLEVDLNGLESSRGDYREAALIEAMNRGEQPVATARAIAENAPDRQTIVFTASVELAERTRDELLELGIRAEAVSGETPKGERREILQRFRNGVTQVVCNCAVLTEGFDCPEIDCVVMARPTKSRALYQQCVGRGLRSVPGKADCLLIDIVGVTEALDLQTSASLVGKDFAAKSGEAPATTLLEEVHRQGALFTDPFTGKLLTRPVTDLFGRSRFAWQRADELGTWQMPLDQAFSIAIVRGSSGWDVVKVRTGKVEGVPDVQVVASCLDGAIVHGFAEEYARTHSAKWLADKRAGWRERPVEPGSKQLSWALQLGIDLEALRNDDGILRKGPVSDAINSVTVARKIRSYARARRRAA